MSGAPFKPHSCRQKAIDGDVGGDDCDDGEYGDDDGDEGDGDAGNDGGDDVDEGSGDDGDGNAKCLVSQSIKIMLTRVAMVLILIVNI